MDKHVACTARSAAGKMGKRIGPLAALVCATALAACAPGPYGGGSLGLIFENGGASISYRPQPGPYGQFSPGYYRPQTGFGPSLQADYGGMSSNGFYPAQPGYDGQASPGLGYGQAQIGLGDQMQTGFGPQFSAGFYPARPGYGGQPSPALGEQPAPAGLGMSGGMGAQGLVSPSAWATSAPFGATRRTGYGPGW